MKVAVVIPTIRPDLFDREFMPAWEQLFRRHGCDVYRVLDGETPTVQRFDYEGPRLWNDVAIEVPACIYNFTDAVRNLGFLAAHRYYKPDVYLSLDDDVLPNGDTIQGHLDALGREVVLDWQNTTETRMNMRGIPYNLPKYPVLLSHGLWSNVPDLDAIQQLQHPGLRDVPYLEQIIPRHVFFPVCAMNFAFRPELLPYAYQAPMGQKLAKDGLEVFDRFADIWGGLVMKYAIDNILAGAAVSGLSCVEHRRASNVWANLRKEAPGMELNETMWKEMPRVLQHVPPSGSDHPYITLFRQRLAEWQKLVQ